MTILRTLILGATLVTTLLQANTVRSDNSDTTPSAMTELSPYKAEYKVSIFGVSGRLNTELQRSGEGYVATQSVYPTGIASLFVHGNITETSTFSVVDAGIEPSHFESADSISHDEKQASIDFNWVQGIVHGTVNNKPIDLAIDGIAQDRVSLQYQLMRDLLSGRDVEQYALVDIDEIKILNIRKIGVKKMKVPAGVFEAVGIENQSNGSSRTTTFWCAPLLGFVPIVIEQHKDGKLKMRAELQNISHVEK